MIYAVQGDTIFDYEGFW